MHDKDAPGKDAPGVEEQARQGPDEAPSPVRAPRFDRSGAAAYEAQIALTNARIREAVLHSFDVRLADAIKRIDRLEGLAERLDGQGKSQVALEKGMDELKADVEDRAMRTGGAMNALANRTTRLEQRVDGVADRTAGLEGLPGRLVRIETDCQAALVAARAAREAAGVAELRAQTAMESAKEVTNATGWRGLAANLLRGAAELVARGGR